MSIYLFYSRSTIDAWWTKREAIGVFNTWSNDRKFRIYYNFSSQWRKWNTFVQNFKPSIAYQSWSIFPSHAAIHNLRQSYGKYLYSIVVVFAASCTFYVNILTISIVSIVKFIILFLVWFRHSTTCTFSCNPDYPRSCHCMASRKNRNVRSRKKRNWVVHNQQKRYY